MPKEEALPYYNWYVLDYRANRKVQRMCWQARALYRELLDEYWIDGALPDDMEQLADICGCTVEEFETYWPQIKSSFTQDASGRWHNEKMDSKRTEKDRLRLVKKAVGRLGGLQKIANAASDQVELAQIESQLATARESLATARRELEDSSNCHIAIAEQEQSKSRAEQEASADMVREIACAHPKNRARNLRPHEVSSGQEAAVFEAMSSEMQIAGCSDREALEMILARVSMLADKVPKTEWRFFKDVAEFFRCREYRKEPEDFFRGGGNGSSKASGGSSPGLDRSQRRIGASDAAFESLYGAAGEDTVRSNDGVLPESGVRPRDDQGVSVRPRPVGDEVRAGVSGRGPAQPASATRPEVLSPSDRSSRGA